MALSRKARRRLLVLGILVGLTLAVAGLFVIQQVRTERQAQAQRTQGMVAFEAGRFEEAADALSRYLRHTPTDVEAQYHFARAQLALVAQEPDRLGNAIRAMQRVVELDPDNREAAHDLLELYTLVGQQNQVLGLAEELLATDPQDTQALHAKAVALMRLEQPAEALEVAETCLELDPDNLAVHLLAMQAMDSLDRPDQALVDRARQWREQYPDDPNFVLLQGYAYALTDQYEQAVQWLRRAAEQTPPNELYLTSLIRFLDAAHLYALSLEVLQTHVQNPENRALFDELVRRLFETGQHQALLERLSTTVTADGLAAAEDPRDAQPDDQASDHGSAVNSDAGDPGAAEPDGAGAPASDDGDTPARPAAVEHLALAAMAHHELGQTDQARTRVEQLAQRENDPAAAAWAAVLEAAMSDGPGRAGRVIRACQNALRTFPNNPYFHAMLADAYASANERELALPAWEKAAALRPTWAAPHVQRARLLLELGRVDEAMNEAEAGLRRLPNSVDAAITLVEARMAALEAGREIDTQRLLRVVEDVQSVVPGEPRTLVLRASLLAQMGRRDAAIEAIRQVLAMAPPPPGQVLLQLAEVSQRHELGLASACYDRLAAIDEPSPEALFVRAVRLADQGQADQGLALLEQAAEGAPPEERVAWQLARARYLERIDDPRARQAWIDLANAHPRNARILQMALEARSTRGDRAFTRQTIERLRASLGKQSLVWKLELARWLLSGPPDERDPNQAAELLQSVIAQAPNRVEPRLLLTQAQEQLGLLPLAIRELRAAAQLEPDSPVIALELARLHQALRHYRNAREYLEQVLRNPDTSAALRRRAAVMLASQGEVELALSTLRSLSEAGHATEPADRLLLAHLYVQHRQPEQAERILRELLEAPTPAIIAFAADFCTARNQPEQAQRVLDRLGELDLSPAERQRLVGDYHSRHGQWAQAAAHYRAAIEAGGDDPGLWHRVVAAHLGTGDAETALAAAEEGLQAHPDDAGLAAMRELAPLVRRFVASPQVRPLIGALLSDAGHRDAAAQALRVVAAAADRNASALEMVRQLEPLADQHGTFQALQVLVARLYLQAGQPEQAATIASRAMETFPTAAEPAWVAAEAYAAADQWAQALVAATEWRRRSVGRTVDADVMIAQARLELGEVRRAQLALQPYLGQALANPDAHPEVIDSYVRTLIAAGRVDEAASLLEPLLDRSPRWLSRWMRLAALALPDPPSVRRWLNEAEARLSADDMPGRITVAQCWWVAGNRLDVSEFRSRARDLIEQVVQQGDASAAAWYHRALMADQAGDADIARESYRQALALDDRLHAARNNLAMLLADDEPTRDEALRLAEAAVNADPDNPHYLDTLAYVQTQVGLCDEAIRNMERAIQLDPNNPLWRTNLARILAQCGREEQATEILDGISE